MKFTYILSLTLFLGLSGTSYAISLDEIINKFGESLKTKTPAELCSKGVTAGDNKLEKFKSLFKSTKETGNVYTYRSLEGNFCRFEIGAAIYALTCTDNSLTDAQVEEAKQATCWKEYGSKFFGTPDGKIDTAKAQARMQELFNTPAGENIKKVICLVNKGPTGKIPIFNYFGKLANCAAG